MTTAGNWTGKTGLPAGDRVSEVLQAQTVLHPGCIVLCLDLWHPSQPGPPGQLALGRKGTTQDLPLGLAPEAARDLAHLLLAAADLLEGKGPAN